MSIQSLRQTINKDFEKPDPEKFKKYTDDLSENSEALEYLTSRGLTPETIEHFLLGYDKDKHAISIPIQKKGEVVNIKYRFLEPQSMKYTQERGCEVWVFNEEGFVEARNKGGIAIVEGEFDCMMMWQNGFKNTVSPASGKDSYAVWLEELDNIPRVYIAMDNDKGGRETAKELSERVGVEKSFDVVYPKGYKDATDFFLENDAEAFRELVKKAKPFHAYSFQGLSDVIESLKENKSSYTELEIMPNIKMEEDWMVVVSGRSNTGKTSYALNIANELVTKGIPTLILPFERGVRTVGRRFIEIRAEKSLVETEFYTDDDWENLIDDVIGLPLYFAMPEEDELTETIKKAKRLFGVKVIVADQPDYVLGSDSKNKMEAIETAVKSLKNLCIELGVIVIMTHHIRKQNPSIKPVEPQLEDLQGSSSLYKVPEAVVMLHKEVEDQIEVSIAKNKGESGKFLFDFVGATGRMTRDPNDDLF